MLKRNIFWNLRKSLAVFGMMIALFCLVSSQAIAQQTTGEVAPQTRNPQDMKVPLQRQHTEVQSTGGEQLLRQDKIIQIPVGVEAQTQDDTKSGDIPGVVWLIAILAVGISVILVRIAFAGKNAESSGQSSQANNITASETDHAVNSKPIKPKSKQIQKKKKKSHNRPQKQRKKQ